MSEQENKKDEAPIPDITEEIKGRSFKTKRGSVKITIDDDPNWEIVRLKGDVRDSYLVDVNNRYEFSPDGGSRFLARPKGMQAYLVSLCLRDPQGKSVPVEVIQQGWDAETITDLYDACSDYNGMSQRVRDLGKKDLKAKEGTGSGSPKS